MEAKPFYSEGLRFSCTRCSACCRFDPGFVFLSDLDINRLAQALQMHYTDFIETYCRWIPAGGGYDQLSLKERSNYDCIFWKDGCTVYDARPLQCRTYPFWSSIVLERESWEAVKAECPGIDQGQWHSKEEIEELLQLREKDPIVLRRR